LESGLRPSAFRSFSLAETYNGHFFRFGLSGPIVGLPSWS
jgi:hypothetical protein